MLFIHLPLHVIHHADCILTTDHVLPAIFQPDEDTLVATAVIAEIASDHDVAEIPPVTEEATTTTQPQSSRRGIAGVYRLNLGIHKTFASRKQTMDSDC